MSGTSFRGVYVAIAVGSADDPARVKYFDDIDYHRALQWLADQYDAQEQSAACARGPGFAGDVSEAVDP